MYICVNMCVYIYTYIYIRIYMYVYIFIYNRLTRMGKLGAELSVLYPLTSFLLLGRSALVPNYLHRVRSSRPRWALIISICVNFVFLLLGHRALGPIYKLRIRSSSCPLTFFVFLILGRRAIGPNRIHRVPSSSSRWAPDAGGYLYLYIYETS